MGVDGLFLSAKECSPCMLVLMGRRLMRKRVIVTSNYVTYVNGLIF